MKKFTLIFALLLCCFLSKAQSYVTIPDSNFVSWLTTNIPAAMSGNQMDTSSSAVTSFTSINISNDSIKDLTGIQYFSGLQSLDCSLNQLDSLPILPTSLTYLNCSFNYLHLIPALPPSLITFICNRNYLTWLPALPATLINFVCEENKLDTLPALPSSLPNLNCSHNLLTRLPALPNSITILDCQTNELDSLPALPASLTSLSCQDNLLASLPALPGTLTAIFCYTNHLTSLPALPGGLDSLECYSNLLGTLPALPATLTYLVCSLNPITSLPALPASLQLLKCYNDSLINLPVLPAALTYLDCNTNYLTSLPGLPGALITLNCSTNSLTALPPLPGALVTLDCSTNLLSGLPALPGSLSSLSCDNNHITLLPGLSALQTLSCQHNLFTTIPAIPSTLQNLICGYNTLTNLPALASVVYLSCNNSTLDSLPSLPNTLTSLDCSANLIDSLPAIPASLSSLTCSFNHLTSLPSLNSIGYLDCTNNQLTSLPSIPPSLSFLNCQSNMITCFPEFPNTITSINLYGNPFTCLANYIPAMDSVTLGYPLCVYGDLVHNPHNCASAEGLVGFTFTDNNSNCIKDTADFNLINIPVRVYDGAGTLLGQTYTASNGVYNFPEPAGTYTAVVDTAGMPISPQCTSPGVDSTVTTSIAVPLISDINFDFNCKPGFDLGVRSAIPDGITFPGVTQNLRIVAGDVTQWYNMHCASGVSGVVKVTVTGPVHYAGPSAGTLTPVLSGTGIYTYTISDFGTVVNSTAFGLKFITDTTAAAGDKISVSVIITPIGGDNDTANNVYNTCYYVSNSHDPNFKETTPKVVGDTYTDYFTYTIHFQNSGSAPAMNIHIADTLDSNLDPSTFQLINFSHANITSLTGHFLNVSFPNIMLPDSSSNADSSKGFVQYRVKALPHRPLGTHIYNTGYIYFDYNSAIITNTTVNTYEGGISGINENNNEITASVFPNPGNGVFALKLEGEKNVIIEVYNMLGEKILDMTTQNESTLIDLTSQPKGIYILKVIGSKQSFNQRIIKQ